MGENRWLLTVRYNVSSAHIRTLLAIILHFTNLLSYFKNEFNLRRTKVKIESLGKFKTNAYFLCSRLFIIYLVVELQKDYSLTTNFRNTLFFRYFPYHK